MNLFEQPDEQPALPPNSQFQENLIREPEVVLLKNASSLEIGTRIGPYEVHEHLGGGGMATVYKAWHLGLERFEALKIPHPQSTPGLEANFLQRLLDEARTAAGLHHPHIVAIHNVSETGAAVPFFAMDLVEGQDLQKLIAQRGRLELEETLQILRQVGAALHYAHARGIVHRDIKPANILLQSDAPTYPWVKVVDFGISRAVEDPGGTRLTTSDLFVGTPEYMSPEQSGSGAVVDYRTDIYSLGIVAYEMLCGQPPFVAGEGVSRISVIVKHISQPPPPLTRYLTDLPDAINDAILRALAKDPAERYQSSADFIAALDAARHAHPLTASTRTANLSAMPSKTKITALEATHTRVLPSLPAEPEMAAPAAEPVTAGPRAASLRALALAMLGGMLLAALLIFGFVMPRLRNDAATPTLAMTKSAVAEEVPHHETPDHKAPGVAKPAAGKPAGKQASTRKAVKRPTAPTGPTRVVRSRRRSSVPFARYTRKNAWIPKGQRRIKRHGVNGIKEELIVTVMRGGRKISSRIAKAWMVKRPVAEIELIGTATPAPGRKRPAKKPAAKTVGAKNAAKPSLKPKKKAPKKAARARPKKKPAAHLSRAGSFRKRSSRLFRSRRRSQARRRPHRLVVPIDHHGGKQVTPLYS